MQSDLSWLLVAQGKQSPHATPKSTPAICLSHAGNLNDILLLTPRVLPILY